MPLHHFVPPPHVLGFVLTCGLAFAAGALLMSRHRWGLLCARGGDHAKTRLRAFCSRNADRSPSAMFATGAGTRNSTGNAAFETYRSATLTELEQEAQAFAKYLDELRHAKDKSEFDAFLNERRRTPTGA